jgi:hypothetical protein
MLRVVLVIDPPSAENQTSFLLEAKVVDLGLCFIQGCQSISTSGGQAASDERWARAVLRPALVLGGCWQGASLVVQRTGFCGALSVLAYLWNHLPDFGAAAVDLVPSLVGFAAGAGASCSRVIFHLLPAISRVAPWPQPCGGPNCRDCPLIVLWLPA